MCMSKDKVHVGQPGHGGRRRRGRSSRSCKQEKPGEIASAVAEPEDPTGAGWPVRREQVQQVQQVQEQEVHVGLAR